MDNSTFAIGNHKSVKYSFVVWPIFLMLFLVSSYMYGSELLSNTIGLLLGIFWGITLPYARKKEWDTFVTFFFLVLFVLVNSFVSNKIGFIASFQTLALAMFCSNFIWFIFKSKLLVYLNSDTEKCL